MPVSKLPALVERDAERPEQTGGEPRQLNSGFDGSSRRTAGRRYCRIAPRISAKRQIYEGQHHMLLYIRS